MRAELRDARTQRDKANARAERARRDDERLRNRQPVPLLIGINRLLRRATRR